MKFMAMAMAKNCKKRAREQEVPVGSSGGGDPVHTPVTLEKKWRKKYRKKHSSLATCPVSSDFAFGPRLGLPVRCRRIFQRTPGGQFFGCFPFLYPASSFR